MTQGEPQVRSVDRAFSILELFSAERPQLTLAEIVDGTALPKTTVVRLLADLQARAMVVPETAHSYVLGPGLLRWVALAHDQWKVNDETKRTMRALVDLIGETVCIYVRQGTRRVPIALHPGVHTVRNVVEVGSLMPLGVGAAGKLLLAHSPELVDTVISRNSTLDPEKLRDELEAIRKAGYSTSNGEREIGAAAVAAPVRNRDGRVIAALGISGPSSRFADGLLDRGLDAVCAAANQVTLHGLGPVEVIL